MSEITSEDPGKKTLRMNLWVSSLSEFKSVRVTVFCGMLCAVGILLGYVATFNFGDYIRVGFSNLPNQIVASLFGPVAGGIFGGVLDILKYIVKPTGAFFPGFTLSAIAEGMIFGLFLYKKKVTIMRVFLSQLIVSILVHLLMNTLWLNMLYGYGFIAILPGRIISNAVMLPINTAITFVVLKSVEKTIAPSFFNGK